METTTSFSETLTELFGCHDTAIGRDLKLNIQKIIEDGSLENTEVHLALLAATTTLNHKPLKEYAKNWLSEKGVEETIIQEAMEGAALGSMLNLYYRFRHYVENTQGSEGLEKYKRVGLRMNGMMKPQMGHEKFEMLTFIVSVINGCEMCVNGHEKKLLDLNVDVEKIHDLARLGSLVKALKDLENAN